MSIVTKCVPSSRRAILSKITAHSASPVSAVVFSFLQTAPHQLRRVPYHPPVRAGGSRCLASSKHGCAPACAKWLLGRRCSDRAPMPACAAVRAG